ncbi:MAG: hypothetical protein A2017_12310 [Lentisphaerae bacterium GWF2_44_16]|nr:MAG: hypothetical protein A2017_12310 [Lentisphaerae bacterium GWF2_44_16]
MRIFLCWLFILFACIQIPLYSQKIQPPLELGELSVKQRVSSEETVTKTLYVYDNSSRTVFFTCDGYNNMTWVMSNAEAKKLTAILGQALELMRKAKIERTKISLELASFSQVKVSFETDNAGHNPYLILTLLDSASKPFQLMLDEETLRSMQTIFNTIDWTYRRV